MNDGKNPPRQVQAHGQRHGAFARSASAVGASGTRYTCTMHPEVVRDVPGTCPKCGMTLVPV